MSVSLRPACFCNQITCPNCYPPIPTLPKPAICTLPADHTVPCNAFPRLLTPDEPRGRRVTGAGYCRPLVVDHRAEQSLGQYIDKRMAVLNGTIDDLQTKLRVAASEREQLREDHQAALTALERLQATLRAERAAHSAYVLGS